MTLGLPPQTAGILEMIPSLPIHSSVLIPLVAGLFLAALMLRAQRLTKQSGQQTRGLTTRQARTARRRASRKRARSAGPNDRGTEMSRINAEESSRPGAGAQETSPEGFRIRWGRTLLTAAGLLAIIGGIGSAIAVPFVSALTWTVPAVFGAVLVASLISLRASAVVRRRAHRRARVERAMRDAMSPEPQVSRDAPPTSAASAAPDDAEQQAAPPFNALNADEAGQGGPDSLVTLDEDGLPDSADRLFAHRDAAVQHQHLSSTGARSEETWDVRSVPAAHYMVAAKAERPEPEPLQQQAPVPSAGVKLKQTAASPERAAGGSDSQESINLDQVLQRRRA